MTDPEETTPRCPGCGAPVLPYASFCEACGHPLVPTEPSPGGEPTGGSQQTRRLGVRNSQLATCPSCGGTIDADGYCQTCGAKAPSTADHYAESPAEWVGGVCDRGVAHVRNEDAMALWADDSRAVLVVCDGVSTSADSDVAARVAATTARDMLVAALSKYPAGEDLGQAFVEAAAAANAQVVATTAPESTNAASATFAAAVVADGRVHYANLGDSRVYFLGRTDQLLLSVDDSLAQSFIEQGMTREEAESLPRAHAITRWLGRDSTEIVPRVGERELTEPGWVVVCSDGLWNYASSPAELATQLDAAAADDDPTAIAGRLVAWANSRGGKDNITVALARVEKPAGQPHSLGDTVPAAGEEPPQHG
jgi:serine/threonine protein phosphatase PrpC